MGKKYKNLFTHITDRQSLWEAYRKASKGKRETVGHLLFQQNEALNIERIIRSLEDDTYAPGQPVEFKVYEPKERIISALPFIDRVVQHSIHAVISPIFEKIFMPTSYACRRNKGTHRGVIKAQSYMRKKENKYVLKLDFKGYFYSIDREILWKELDKKISCKRTLKLLEQFHPRAGKGIPIGNLTSQLLANIYGHILDRHLTHDLKIKNWIRYMDDTVIFGESIEELRSIYEELSVFIEREMKLSWSKWSITSTDRELNYLGYRIFKTHKLIRKDSIRRAKRKTKTLSREKLEKFLKSWKGHLQWANTFNLKQSLRELS